MFMWRSVGFLLCTGLLLEPALAEGPAKFLPPAADVNQARVPHGTREKDPLAEEFGLMPPTPDQLFRVQSEQGLKERLRQEMPKVKNVDFPRDAVLAAPSADLTPFPEQIAFTVSGAICYRQLYFEDKRTERFGRYVPCV